MPQSYRSRRWKNTKAHTWPGFNWPILLVQGLGLVGAIVSSYWFGGYDFAVGEIRSWGMFTLAWLIIANIAFLFFNWLMAPSRIAKEDADRIADLEEKIAGDRRRLFIKNRIGEFMVSGGGMQKECMTSQDHDELERRMDKWATDTYNFIERTFGSGDATLFNSPAGIVLYASTHPNNDLKKAMERRLQRLAHIMQRIDSTTINPDFQEEVS